MCCLKINKRRSNYVLIFYIIKEQNKDLVFSFELKAFVKDKKENKKEKVLNGHLINLLQHAVRSHIQHIMLCNIEHIKIEAILMCVLV